MIRMTQKEWDETSPDYKGIKDGVRSALIFRPGIGTVSEPVEIVEG